MLWLVIGAFGGSAALGLLFLMRGVSMLSVKKSYDIYAPSLRGLAIFQILLVLAGTSLLATIVKTHPVVKAGVATHSMEIRLDPKHSVVYPIDADKNTTVEIDGGKVKITAAKQ